MARLGPSPASAFYSRHHSSYSPQTSMDSQTLLKALSELDWKNLRAQATEPADLCGIYNIAALVLYGTNALPIRAKILLDRLFSVLQRHEVTQVLNGLGWSLEDYTRSYRAGDRQLQIVSEEEEQLVLSQFLRYGETRSVAEQFLNSSPPERIPSPMDQTPPAHSQPTVKSEPTSYTSPITPIKALRLMIPPVMNNLSTPGMAECPAPQVPAWQMPPLSQPPLVRAHTTSPQLSSEPVTPTRPEESVLNLSRDAPVSAATSVAAKSPSVPHSIEDRHDRHDDDDSINGRRQQQPSRGRRSTGRPLPADISTDLFNPHLGKKRVQCNACLKTFCDKGALKIHFSAVHLKETHQCTVEGCNMTFSSRRSRNRHSANPNPRLHSPNLRRKISPNDGRSAQTGLLMPPTGLPIPGGPFHLPFGPYPCPPMMPHGMGHDGEDYYYRAESGSGMSVRSDGDDGHEGSLSVSEDNIKMSQSDTDEAESFDCLSVDNQSVKEEEPPRKRGRKSQNPTKCSLRVDDVDAVSMDGDASRDELRPSSGDEIRPRSRNELRPSSHDAYERRQASASPVDHSGRKSPRPSTPRSSRSTKRSPVPSPGPSPPHSPDRASNDDALPDENHKSRPEPPDDVKRKMPTPDKLFSLFPPEFLSRLYSEQLGYPMNGERLLLPFPGMGFPGLPYPFLGNGMELKKPSSSSTRSSPVSPALSDVKLPTPDRDGRLPCYYCSAPCSDSAALRDHIAANHSNKLYRCSELGCSKAYTSRAARNRHCEEHDRQANHDSINRYRGVRLNSASSVENGS